MRNLILILSTVFTICLSCKAQDQKPVISILGMIHLHNPGADEVNMDVGNIHSDKRQAELKQLIDLVVRFKPTKIAIEATLGDTLWSQTYYTNYLNDVLEKEMNEEDKWRMSGETVQVSYPLAKQMGHDKLYPIDAHTEFDTAPVYAYAEQNNQDVQLAEFKELISSMQNDMKSISEGSVLDIIKFANSDEFDKNYNQTFYLKHLVSFGKEGNYIGTDVVSKWYYRNLKIFTNLNRIVEPTDRVLVIYGAGHKDILVDLIKDRADWEYYDVNKLLHHKK
ncbi:DUF5694 domain-containing protein [Aquimarina macrocephali]|uniref:DUF5694 domain-containing protein n=1 Tax=Aquimarina macrocephali TaxID=666563 RepID=UPI000463FCBF|nr:DUF5694 domain-containing protein [Aquimarina macrocephali]